MDLSADPAFVAVKAAGHEDRLAALERELAEERATGAREAVARWMIEHSIATGHGDTLDDLLGELAATARRDAFEEAAKVADREEAECRDSANGTEGERAYWAPCANTARLIAKDIRSLATVPGGEGKSETYRTETGWRSMDSAPRGRNVLLLDTSSGTHEFHTVGFRPPSEGPWQTDADHYMRFTPTHWMPLPATPDA